MDGSAVPKELQQRMLALLEDAFNAGFVAGSDYAREAILRAAQSPTVGKPSIPLSASFVIAANARDRARRGSARLAVHAVLKNKSGLRLEEIEAAAVSLDPSLSPRSVGGELRRMEGREYERRGKFWSLKCTEQTHGPLAEIGGTTGAVTPAAEKPPDMEEANAAP